MILNYFDKKIRLRLFQLAQQIHYIKKGTFTATPETIFEVVKNTHKYSDFIPWCKKSSITKYISPTQNYTSLTIAFQKVKQLSYLSHVLISGENQKLKNYRIQSTCKEQPLKSLVSIWQIQKDSIIQGDLQQSIVHYSIQYEFSSPLLQLTSHFFLDYVGESMWLIFKQQAEKKQKQIDQQKHQNNKNEQQNHITFGKSVKNNQTQEQFQASNIQKIDFTLPATNLTQYLAKNKKIHQIYCINSQFKSKLDKWDHLLHGTKDFEVKLEFKIKNYLIHKN